jgi:uncharacterized membrane protein
MKRLLFVLYIFSGMMALTLWLLAGGVSFFYFIKDYEYVDRVRFWLSYICHQRPDRSLWLWHHPVGLCFRCWAIYGAYSGTVLGGLVWRSFRFPNFIVLILIIPIFLDVGLQGLHLWSGSNWARMVTGGAFGVGSAILVRKVLQAVSPSSSCA